MSAKKIGGGEVSRFELAILLLLYIFFGLLVCVLVTLGIFWIGGVLN
jgi:hypothetical protein